MDEIVRPRYEEMVGELIRHRQLHCFPLRVRSRAKQIAQDVLAVLFPHFSETMLCDSDEVGAEVSRIESEILEIMRSLQPEYKVPQPHLIERFFDSLPEIYQGLALDARAIHQGDPAAFSVDEVILTYPGFYAVAIHRIAHVLHELGYPLLPRLLTEHAHEVTGIDIHPGATLGRSFFIDHGTGIVIGETAVIGNGVKIYQGVTIGALAVQKSLANRKRHPTIEDNVVVYANATILGGDTVIGHDSIIGGNAWITESIPPFSIVGRSSDVRPRRSAETGELEFYI